MEQDDLGDWLSPLSRNNEAPPSPSPLAAPPGTPHAGVGAGAGLVHGSSATNDPAQPHLVGAEEDVRELGAVGGVCDHRARASGLKPYGEQEEGLEKEFFLPRSSQGLKCSCRGGWWCTTPEKPFGSLLIANPVSSPPPGMYVRATYTD